MKWEYRFYEAHISRGKRVHEEALNELGLDGWEVVAVWPEPRGTDMIQRMFLKRPLERWRRKRNGKVPEGGRNYLFGPRSV